MEKLETKITAIIKTLERPAKLLNLVNSIRRFYPKLPIVIMDDSQAPIVHDWDKSTFYHYTEYDIGLSEGRNRAVAQVKTDYTLLLDDDHFFTEKTRIEEFLSILENSSYDLVGGQVVDFGKRVRLFRGTFGIIDDGLFLKYSLKGKEFEGHRRYDFVENFFLARTELLRKSPWDADLKIYEHMEFFWRIKKIDTKITYAGKVSIDHYPEFVCDDYHKNDKSRNQKYLAMRLERSDYFHSLACKKMGFGYPLTVSSVYEGPLGLFKLYTIVMNWIVENKNKNIFGKWVWKLFNLFEPFLRVGYISWKKRWFSSRGGD